MPKKWKVPKLPKESTEEQKKVHEEEKAKAKAEYDDEKQRFS